MSERFDLGISKKPRPNRRIEGPDKKSDDDNVMSRRTFLKIGLGAGALAATGIGGKMAWDKLRELSDQEDIDGKEKGSDTIGPTESQKRIELQDKEVIGNTIKDQIVNLDRIVLDRNTKKAIQERWRKSYSAEGENSYGLKKALERMSPWAEEMKAVFRKVGIPQEYAYLAIPESHFDLDAVSRKYAAGPYQFTKDTALRFGLDVGDSFDQRFDPIASAEACAKHLKYSYERFNNDWDLALADYNGAYTNRYAEFRKNKSERNYDDYLAWREDRLNKFLDQPYFTHEVVKRDGNITNIAKKYGLSVEQITKFNGMSDDRIIVGREIKLPPEVSVKMELLKDSLENLNYPEKFYAVLQVIKEENLSEKIVAEKLDFDLVETPRAKTADFEYMIKKGDGLLVVAREVIARAKKIDARANFSVIKVQEVIQKQNGIGDPRKIRPGQKLHIQLPMERPMTLNDVALKHGMDVSLLKKLNPAVIKEGVALPAGRKLRIPKK